MKSSEIKITVEKITQHVAAGLNRGEDGAPKTCNVGGVTRPMTSSQCRKRVCREYMRECARELGIADEMDLTRTHAVGPMIEDALAGKGIGAGGAKALSDLAVIALGGKPKEKKNKSKSKASSAKTKKQKEVQEIQEEEEDNEELEELEDEVEEGEGVEDQPDCISASTSKLTSTIIPITRAELDGIVKFLNEQKESILPPMVEAMNKFEKAMQAYAPGQKKQKKPQFSNFIPPALTRDLRKVISCSSKVSGELALMGRFLAKSDALGNFRAAILVPAGFGVQTYKPEYDSWVGTDDQHSKMRNDGTPYVKDKVQNMGVRINTSNFYYERLVIEADRVAQAIGVERTNKMIIAMLRSIVFGKYFGGRSYAANDAMPSYLRVSVGPRSYNNQGAFSVPVVAENDFDNIALMTVQRLEEYVKNDVKKFGFPPLHVQQMCLDIDRPQDSTSFEDMLEQLGKFLNGNE